MILAAIAGLVLDRTVVEGAVLPAILIGIIVALCMPAKSACTVNFAKQDKADAGS